MIGATTIDKDLKEHFKKSLDADVTYNRLKLRGIITEKEKSKC
jgi:hypothetical protein